MEIDVLQVLTFYEDKKYVKVISEIDKNTKSIIELGDDLVGIYLLSCYKLNKQKKFIQTMERISKVQDMRRLLFFNKMLGLFLREDNEKFIKIILKIVKNDNLMKLELEGLVLEHQVRGIYSKKDMDTKKFGKKIRNLLDNDDFYNTNSSRKTLDALKSRVRKHYRNKNFDLIITWLDGLNINDQNFEIYHYFMLTRRMMGETDLVLKDCIHCFSLVTDLQKIEKILDLLYTMGKNKEIIQLVDNSKSERISFKSSLIYARSIKKIGDEKGAERIIDSAKLNVQNNILNSEKGVAEIITDLKEISSVGDIETSENLLYKLIRRKNFSKDIIESEEINNIIKLVEMTLDNQKKLRIKDSIVISRMLIKEKRYQESLRLLSPYIIHGITNSADLFDLYILSANGSGKKSLIEKMIRNHASGLKITTIERISNTLEINGLYKIHKLLILNCSNQGLNSYKLIRSYFNIFDKYADHVNPKEILLRISKNKTIDPKMIIYFVERFIKSGLEKEMNIANIIMTLRVDMVTRILCNLRINNVNEIKNDRIYSEIFKLKTEDYIKGDSYSANFIRMIIEVINSTHYENNDEIAIKIIQHFKLDKEFREQIITGYIRSLIKTDNFRIVEKIITNFYDDITKIQRWSIMLEIGQVDLVKEEIIENEKSLPSNINQLNSLKSIYFKLKMFNKYIELSEKKIIEGDFKLQDLTRYFFSLYKLGRDEDCIRIYKIIYNKFNHNPMKRAMIALVGYDFSLNKEYIDDIELSIMMNSDKYDIPLFVSRTFLNMERIDLAFYFYKFTLKNGQKEKPVIELGKNIKNILKDLRIDPNSISRDKLTETPIYIDVEVIRRVIEITKGDLITSYKTRNIAIQSHTLDIGGAERQASYLLNLLETKVVDNTSYALITHKIPNKSEINKTYYADININNTDIKEYIKFDSKQVLEIAPTAKGKNEKINRIIRHLNPLKARRLRNMIKIFSEGRYNIIHTWQDYCNIYGGLAALACGKERIIMSARTLPPVKKGKLASRQGRSYRECYQILLARNNVILTHNSEFGKYAYQEWLGGEKNKHLTIHNGLDVKKIVKIGKGRHNIREELGITNDDLVLGYVGRFTTDKRPWLFLKIVERILENRDDKKSKLLDDWYIKNEGISKSILGFEKPNWKKIGEIKIIMVGDGPQFETAKKIVESSEIMRNKVHLVGFSKDVSSYMRQFDVLLLTSKVEGLPNVLIEAQAHSIPVVSTNAGGAKECFIEGKTGFLSESSNISELEFLLGKVLSDKKFIQVAKKDSKKFIKNKFGQKTYSENINKLYGRN